MSTGPWSTETDRFMAFALLGNMAIDSVTKEAYWTDATKLAQ